MSHRASRLVAPVVAGLLLALRSTTIAAVDLGPLLAGPDTMVILDGGTDYTVSETALAATKTLVCNGAHIASTGGPIRIGGSALVLTIDGCHLSGSGWALLGAQNGAQLVIQNGTTVAGNGNNSCLYVADAMLDMTGGTLDHCRWGVNMENAEVALHGVTITDVEFGVQNVAGAATLDDGCSLTNLHPALTGVGVALIASPSHPTRAASAIVRDSTFTGFGNAIDIQPTAAQGLPAGTVTIERCTFTTQVYSALAVVDAVDVTMRQSRVVDAQTDGIFLVNSTATIEDSEVLGSLNSGVSFYGCPDGGVLRRSLVRNSAHQGVAIVADPVHDRPSTDVRLIDNTLDGNVIANVLVDDRSEASLQGTLFLGAPDASVRIHGSPSTQLVAGLLLDSHAGLEVKGGATATAGLSIVRGHTNHGILVYENAGFSLAHSALLENAGPPNTVDYDVFVNGGATVAVSRSALGTPGARGLYDNAGVVTTAQHNWWADPSGPALLSGPGGTGSVLGWNTDNGSTVTYDPWLSSSPLDAVVDRTLSLTADTTTTWEASPSVTLTLTGASAASPVAGGRAAVLRLHDAGTLANPMPPIGTFFDGVLVVWVDYDLLSKTASATLRIATTSSEPTATLFRLGDDGLWTEVPSTWDAAARAALFAPSDPKLVHGVFALGDGTAAACSTARDCLRALIGVAPCAEPLPAKLRTQLDRKLKAAVRRLDKAVQAPTDTKRTKLVARARAIVTAIETIARRAVSARRSISAPCADVLARSTVLPLQLLDANLL
jgi:hypothetical protein